MLAPHDGFVVCCAVRVPQASRFLICRTYRLRKRFPYDTEPVVILAAAISEPDSEMSAVSIVVGVEGAARLLSQRRNSLAFILSTSFTICDV